MSAGRLMKFDGQVAFNPTELTESDRKFAGWLTVAVKDRQGDIVVPEGITAEEYIKVMGGPLLDMHSNKPIGRITQMELRPKKLANGEMVQGVYVEGFIFKAPEGMKEYPAWTSAWEEIVGSFQMGKPLGLSLGGDPEGVHMRCNGTECVRVVPITYLEEVSLVRRSSRPANPESMLEDYNKAFVKAEDVLPSTIGLTKAMPAAVQEKPCDCGLCGSMRKSAGDESENEEGTDGTLMSVSPNNFEVGVGVIRNNGDLKKARRGQLPRSTLHAARQKSLTSLRHLAENFDDYVGFLPEEHQAILHGHKDGDENMEGFGDWANLFSGKMRRDPKRHGKPTHPRSYFIHNLQDHLLNKFSAQSNASLRGKTKDEESEEDIGFRPTSPDEPLHPETILRTLQNGIERANAHHTERTGHNVDVGAYRSRAPNTLMERDYNVTTGEVDRPTKARKRHLDVLRRTQQNYGSTGGATPRTDTQAGRSPSHSSGLPLKPALNNTPAMGEADSPEAVAHQRSLTSPDQRAPSASRPKGQQPRYYKEDHRIEKAKEKPQYNPYDTSRKPTGPKISDANDPALQNYKEQRNQAAEERKKQLEQKTRNRGAFGGTGSRSMTRTDGRITKEGEQEYSARDIRGEVPKEDKRRVPRAPKRPKGYMARDPQGNPVVVAYHERDDGTFTTHYRWTNPSDNTPRHHWHVGVSPEHVKDHEALTEETGLEWAPTPRSMDKYIVRTQNPIKGRATRMPGNQVMTADNYGPNINPETGLESTTSRKSPDFLDFVKGWQGALGTPHIPSHLQEIGVDQDLVDSTDVGPAEEPVSTASVPEGAMGNTELAQQAGKFKMGGKDLGALDLYEQDREAQMGDDYAPSMQHAVRRVLDTVHDGVRKQPRNSVNSQNLPVGRSLQPGNLEDLNRATHEIFGHEYDESQPHMNPDIGDPEAEARLREAGKSPYEARMSVARDKVLQHLGLQERRGNKEIETEDGRKVQAGTAPGYKKPGFSLEDLPNDVRARLDTLHQRPVRRDATKRRLDQDDPHKKYGPVFAELQRHHTEQGRLSPDVGDAFPRSYANVYQKFFEGKKKYPSLQEHLDSLAIHHSGGDVSQLAPDQDPEVARANGRKAGMHAMAVVNHMDKLHRTGQLQQFAEAPYAPEREERFEDQEQKKKEIAERRENERKARLIAGQEKPSKGPSFRDRGHEQHTLAHLKNVAAQDGHEGQERAKHVLSLYDKASSSGDPKALEAFKGALSLYRENVLKPSLAAGKAGRKPHPQMADPNEPDNVKRQFKIKVPKGLEITADSPHIGEIPDGVPGEPEHVRHAVALTASAIHHGYKARQSGGLASDDGVKHQSHAVNALKSLKDMGKFYGWSDGHKKSLYDHGLRVANSHADVERQKQRQAAGKAVEVDTPKPKGPTASTTPPQPQLPKSQLGDARRNAAAQKEGQ